MIIVYGGPFDDSLLFRWKGTVLPHTWRKSLSTAALSAVLALVYNQERTLAKVTGQDSLLLHLLDDAGRLFSLLTSLVTFILGFFNATVYGRWWKYRDLCGVVSGRSVDTAVMFAAYIDAKQKDRRKELLRLLWLAQALHLMEALGETDLKPLLTRGLLEPATREMRVLETCISGRSSLAYGWLVDKVVECVNAGTATPAESSGHVLQMIQANITSMRGAAADVVMYLRTPIPLGYVHLVQVIVNIYVFIVAPCGLSTEFASMAPFMSAVVTTFFSGLLALGRMMMNPFHDKMHDRFEVHDYLNGVMQTTTNIIKNVPLNQPGESANLPGSSTECHLGELRDSPMDSPISPSCTLIRRR
eukprot:TRINITY_DN54722_c0_g1_i1.p1 TRINITY_DN54722_c0_g1~~TRINITY_DN54722_c0_g1_i1.p1  ORF type:complete len:359 (-),score=40.51 TRINITY_DN54722_c0_g1_i1:58-1134(-)